MISSFINVVDAKKHSRWKFYALGMGRNTIGLSSLVTFVVNNSKGKDHGLHIPVSYIAMKGVRIILKQEINSFIYDSFIHSFAAHVCSTCGKGFKEQGALSRHYRLHNGDRPYACTECSSRFRWKAGLDTHMRTHRLECSLVASNTSELGEHQST